jgi:hypothetical protein
MRAAVWAIVAAIGCDRGHPREKPAAPVPPSVPQGATSPAAAPGCTLSAIPSRYPAAKRLVAIGDLHGDLAATRSALRAAGAIDEADRWIGGELVVVQTGDVLDRGDDEQAILDLLFRLEGEAKAAGGALIALLGNHELMNAAGDFRYVTPGAMTDFDEVATDRLAALAPGGVYARKLAQLNVIAIVGDTVFSHAGVLGDWTSQVDEVNRSSRCWLDGQSGGPQSGPSTLTSEDSPVWTRAIGGDPADCGAVAPALAALGVTRMVVGHTVQRMITSACDGAVWRIDVGLGKNYGGPIEVLELVPGVAPRVLRGTR